MAKAGATFDLLLDKATSPLLLDTDWEAILQICDLLQQGDAQTAKYAIGAIKKKLKDSSNNPRVALYDLEVLESVVKNCGPAVRDEAANRQSMEELKELVKKPTTDANVRSKVLYLVQAWAQAFRTEPRGKAVQDAYQSLRSDGHVFPELRESDAMFFSAEREAPPRWADGDTCHRCRAPFAFLIAMKHHCRNCGQAFCARCSSKTAVVPKVAGDKEVRVCDPCHELLSSPKRKSKTGKAAKGKASGSSPVQQSHPGETALPSAPVPSQGREEQLRAEEELQLAIALSQSEAEEKERTSRHRRDASYPYYPKAPGGPAPALLYSSPANASAPSDEDSAEHPELARYLNRPYWEKKQEDFSSEACRRGPTPSAPAPTPLAEQLLPPPVEDGHHRRGAPLQQPDSTAAGQTRPYPPGGDEEEPEESYQQFLKGLQNNVSTFLNRVLSNQARRRSSARDSAAASLFQCVAEARPRLLERLAQLEERRLRHERLQDKLAQALEARAALEALRDEHREAERRRREEAEARRREQLARKLDVMRQRKRELLETQRLQAVRRGQEESERLLLQKQQLAAAASQARPGPPGPHFPQMPYAPQAQGLPYQSGQYQPGAADAGMANGYAHHSADAAAVSVSNGPPAYPGQEDPSSPPTANPAFSGWTTLASHQDYHQGLPAPPPPPPQQQQFYLPRADQGPPAGPMSHQAAPLPADGMAYAGYQQPFDMQGMRSALSMPPPPPPAAPLPPQQQQQQQQVYQQQRAPPSGGHRQPQQQQQSAQAEAQLISFD